MNRAQAFQNRVLRDVEDDAKAAAEVRATLSEARAAIVLAQRSSRALEGSSHAKAQQMYKAAVARIDAILGAR